VCVLCNQRPKNFFSRFLRAVHYTSFRLRRKMNSRMEIKEGIGEQPYTVAGCSSSSSRNYYQLYNERVRFVCTALVLHGNKLAAGRVSQPQKSRNAERKLKPKSTFWGLFWRSLSLSLCVCVIRLVVILWRGEDLDSPAGFPAKPLFLYNIPPPKFPSLSGPAEQKSFFFPLSRSGLIIDSFSFVYT
jgi:hypothetical protein